MTSTFSFTAVNCAALPHLRTLLRRWLPDGQLKTDEYVARNPRRPDRHPGSFKINVRTGRWADFATSDARGGDVISLAASLWECSQLEAALMLAAILQGMTDDA